MTHNLRYVCLWIILVELISVTSSCAGRYDEKKNTELLHIHKKNKYNILPLREICIDCFLKL